MSSFPECTGHYYGVDYRWGAAPLVGLLWPYVPLIPYTREIVAPSSLALLLLAACAGQPAGMPAALKRPLP
jgi:hypothetical protein